MRVLISNGSLKGWTYGFNKKMGQKTSINLSIWMLLS